MKQQLISYLHWKYLLFTILFLSAGVSQAQYSYLLEHAVCFSNGTHIYQENGKYGFRNFEKRLTKPVYDTIFQFGKNYCVVKNGDNYSILGKELESRFNETIIQAERSFDNRFSKYIQLKLVTSDFDTLVYTIGTKDDQPIVYQDSEAWKSFHFYPSSGDNQVLSPEIMPTYDPDNYTYQLNDRTKEKWVDSVHLLKDSSFFYLANGQEIRQKKLTWDNYLGRYYFTQELKEKTVLFDISMGDTLLQFPKTSNIQLSYYKNEPYFELFGYPGTLKTRTLYNLSGEVITSFASSLPLNSDNGLLYETIENGEDQIYPFGRFRHFNLYNFKEGTVLLKNVVEIDQYQNIKIFRAQNRGVFYLLENDKIIDSIITKKHRLYLQGEDQLDEPENRLLAVTDGENQSLNVSTYILSTSSHFKTQFSGYYSVYFDPYYHNYSVYYSHYDHKKPEKSIDRIGLYDEKSNKINFANDNEIRIQVGPKQFITGDSIVRLVDFNGNLLSDKIITSVDDDELDDYKYVTFTIDGKKYLYNQQFELICEDCDLSVTFRSSGYSSVYPCCFLKRSGEPGYKLMNKKLELLLDNGKYIQNCTFLNNILVLHNTDNSIDYVSLETLQK